MHGDSIEGAGQRKIGPFPVLPPIIRMSVVHHDRDQPIARREAACGSQPGGKAKPRDFHNVGTTRHLGVAKVGEQIAENMRPLARQQPQGADVPVVGISIDDVNRVVAIELVDLVKTFPTGSFQPIRSTNSRLRSANMEVAGNPRANSLA